MKNTQRGFIVPLLLAVIAILLIGGGAYIYTQNQKTPEAVNQIVQATSTTPVTQKNTAAKASITVLSPNGGEEFTTLIPVRWTSENVQGDVTIQAFLASRNIFTVSSVPNTGSKDINLSDIYKSDAAAVPVVIKVCSSNNVCGTSNSFSISFKPASSTAGVSHCGMTITSPAKNAKITFPLTISGVVDNRDYAKLGCSWTMFEGEAGTAQIYYKGTPTSQWSRLGNPVVVPVLNWMTEGPVPFSVTLNFNNDGIGLGSTNPMKIVFTDNQQKDNTPATTLELPISF